MFQSDSIEWTAGGLQPAHNEHLAAARTLALFYNFPFSHISQPRH